MVAMLIIIIIIANYYITVKFDVGIRGVKTELLQKVLLHVSVRVLHIYILKKMLLGFLWHMMKKYYSVLIIMLLS